MKTIAAAILAVALLVGLAAWVTRSSPRETLERALRKAGFLPDRLREISEQIEAYSTMLARLRDSVGPLRGLAGTMRTRAARLREGASKHEGEAAQIEALREKGAERSSAARRLNISESELDRLLLSAKVAGPEILKQAQFEKATAKAYDVRLQALEDWLKNVENTMALASLRLPLLRAKYDELKELANICEALDRVGLGGTAEDRLGDLESRIDGLLDQAHAQFLSPEEDRTVKTLLEASRNLQDTLAPEEEAPRALPR